jgi:RHS repeat-associated protein
MKKVSTLLFGAMSLIQQPVQAGTTTYLYTDPQGTPLAEADDRGNIIAISDYRPYGAKILGATSNGPGYTGHVSDAETQLIYMQARYYDGNVGEFLSTDPEPPKPGDVFSFNRYLYVFANPYSYVDPTGMYGRGSGFTDRQWQRFDAAQQRSAQKLRNAAVGIMSAFETGQGVAEMQKAFEKSFGPGTATPENLGLVAGHLAEMAGALEDDGSRGFIANGLTASQAEAAGLDPKNTLAAAPVGGTVMYANLDHASFNDKSKLAWAIGHEAAHDFGLGHGTVNGVTAYKFGFEIQRDAFKQLPLVDPNAAMHNPDTLMDYAQ